MFPFQLNINDLFSSNDISSDPHQDLHLQDTTPIMLLGQSDPFQPTTFTNFSSQEAHDLPIIYPISNIIGDHDNKKIVRKEIERQRRKQMSTLHASLRSLLPADSIKGKRSMSDHLDEAAKYIKHLQSNIKKLSIKRDKLKDLWDGSSSSDEQRKCSHNNVTNTSVKVYSHVFGVEVVISSACNEENVVLSRVVEAMVKEGFDVISSISTKTDTRFYHTIQCQGRHLTCEDLTALQHRLKNAIFS
ncbi:basic helix-loop-helix (bHLH) DNA-binding superfamily protein [Euphorbia peplus]|nr:basic helix-loop-helix (bHLH) DNA-binding superfamily protein [Euphorbia peplus]